MLAKNLLAINPRRLAISLLGLCGFVVLIAVGGQLFGSAISRVATVFMVSLIGVIGMGVYSGNSGVLSFGHVAFMGIGAYASALLTVPSQMKNMTLPNLPDWLIATEMGLLPATVIAILFTMLVALALGLAIYKLEGSSATITTLGILVIVHGIIIGWRDVTRGAQSFFGVPIATGVWVALAGCLFAIIVARVFRDSVTGLKLRAGRENAIAASAAGVKIQRERLIAWVVSAALMALAGVLLGHFLGAFSPKKFFFVDTFFLLSMLIVGGMTTVTGAVVGAVAITLVTEILRRVEGGVEILGIQLPEIFGTTQIGIGLIILLVMFKRADGLTGFLEWEERFLPAQKLPEFKGAQKKAAPGCLSATNVVKRFGGLVAVDNVSLKINAGEIVGLIGPNGSGKTTLMNAMSGVQRAEEGLIRFDDVDLSKATPQVFAGLGIARTFQNIRLFDQLSVQQNVLVAGLNGWPKRTVVQATARAEAALNWMEMAPKASAIANTLSYGDQRRVEIARALALEPSILFLDEPAAGMNSEETHALMETLRRLRSEIGLGILIVDHDLKLITSLCDRIIVMNEGKVIAQGQPKEIQKDPAVVEAYLGRKSN